MASGFASFVDLLCLGLVAAVADVLEVSIDSSDDLLLKVGESLKFVIAGFPGEVVPDAAAAAAAAAA